MPNKPRHSYGRLTKSKGVKHKQSIRPFGKRESSTVLNPSTIRTGLSLKTVHDLLFNWDSHQNERDLVIFMD